MQKGAVAFLDILGFKGIWQNRRANEVLEILTKEAPALVKDLYKEPPPEWRPEDSQPPQITVLSDTLVITMESEGRPILFFLAEFLLKVMDYFIKKNLFLRGAIGFGEYTQKLNSFIGPVIDEVAEWHEKADWIGVIATPKSSYMIDLVPSFKVGYFGFNVPIFIKYHVPEKGGYRHHLNALNWPGFLLSVYNDELQGEGRAKVRHEMVARFANQKPFNAGVLIKYENTLQFVDYGVETVQFPEGSK